jgi:large subunit ribosomal protein L22
MLVRSTAKLRFLSIPPRKMRLVADLVKGMPVEKALDVLNFTPKIAARHLAKTLKSAAANALSREGTDNLRPEDMVVENIIVDAAPTAKRIRFQSMGRVFRYRKRFCHLTVNVSGHMEIVADKPTKARVKKAEKDAVEGSETTEKRAATKKKEPVKKTTRRDMPSKKVSTRSKTTVKKTSTSKKTG